MSPRKTKYHPYSKKFPATDVMGICPVCNEKVLRGDGFIMEEKFEPTMHKVYIHHSRWDKCLEKHFELQKEDEEKLRKEKLGFPSNPLDDFIKKYKS